MHFVHAGARAVLNTKPVDKVIVAGSSATLHCTSNQSSSEVNWMLGYSSPEKYIVQNCSVLDDYTVDFTVNRTSAGQCDLMVISASSWHSGTYFCTDTEDSNGTAAFVSVSGKQIIDYRFFVYKTVFELSGRIAPTLVNLTVC